MTEVYVSGVRIPYTHDWLYRVYVDGAVREQINSTVKWTPQEMLDVQGYYAEALTGYILGGEVE